MGMESVLYRSDRWERVAGGHRAALGLRQHEFEQAHHCADVAEVERRKRGLKTSERDRRLLMDEERGVAGVDVEDRSFHDVRVAVDRDSRDHQRAERGT